MNLSRREEAHQPTTAEARSRQTAMEAERHWWVQRLTEIAARYHRRAVSEGVGAGDAAQDIDALIAERTR